MANGTGTSSADVVKTAAQKLLDEALALTEHERRELMAALHDSVEPALVQLSPEWTAELEGRIGKLERGEVEPVDWPRAQARIRAELAKR